MKNGSVRFPNSPIVKLALACQPQTESSAREACAIQEFVGQDDVVCCGRGVAVDDEAATNEDLGEDARRRCRRR